MIMRLLACFAVLILSSLQGGCASAGGPSDEAQPAAARRDAAPSQSQTRRQETAQRRAHVRFDHLTCPADAPPEAPICSQRYQLTLRDGETYKVFIRNTQPDSFTYVARAIRRVEELQVEADPDLPVLRDTLLHFQHDRRFGGYVLSIRRINQDVVSRLGEADLTVEVTTSEWRVGFGGGFTASGLVDPAYGISTQIVTAENGAQATEMRVVREEDREDDLRLGVASMVHAWHTRAPWIALSFGLGLNEDRGQDYFIGPTWRLGDVANISLGLVAGRVHRLPAGINDGQVVTDPNILSDLGTRIGWNGFLSISYTFLGTRDALTRPFAPPQAVPTPGNGAAPPADPSPVEPAAPPAANVTAGGEIAQRVGVPGQPVRDSLFVRVIGPNDEPISGETVSWQVIRGSATVANPRTTTDENGCTATQIVLGAGAVQPITVQAALRVIGDQTGTVDFTITTVGDPAALPPPLQEISCRR